MLARIISGRPAKPDKEGSSTRGASPAAGSYRLAVCPSCGHLCEVPDESSRPRRAQAREPQPPPAGPGPRRAR